MARFIYERLTESRTIRFHLRHERVSSECADDVKYLEMLENRVKALSGKQDKLDEPTRTAWQSARKLINEPPKQFQGSGASLHEKVDGQMLADFRAQAADLLVKLDAAVKNRNQKGE
jgi:hypothetical protein